MSEVGSVNVKLTTDETKFVSGIERAAASLEKLVDHFEDVRDKNKDLEADAAKTGDALGKLGDRLRSTSNVCRDLVTGMLKISSETEQFRNTLVTLTGSVDEAEQQLAYFKKAAVDMPFDLQGVMKAGVQFKSFGLDVERFLPIAGDLASVFGRSIPEASLALGKALAGSQDGITMLQDSWGITKRDLIDAGAHLKSTGAIALDTSDDLEALALAVEKVAETKKYTGAMAAQMDTLQGKISNAEDAVYNLKGAMGDALAPTMKDLVGRFADGVNALNGLDAGQKAAVATAVGLTAACGFLATGALGLAAAWGTAKLAMDALGVSMKLSPFGLIVTGIGLAAGAMYTYTKSIEANTAALEKNIATEEKRAKTVRDFKAKGNIDASGHIVSTKGMSSKDLEEIVGRREEEFRAAAGSTDSKPQWNPKTWKFDQVADNRAEKQAAAQRLTEARAALEAKKAEEAKAAADAKKNAPHAPTKEETKQAERDRRSALKDELAGVSQGLAARRMSKEEAIKSYQQILQTSAKTAEERRDIENRIAQIEGQLADKRASDAKKAEHEKANEAKKAEREVEKDRKRHEQEQKKAEAQALRDRQKLLREQEKAHKDSLREQAREARAHEKAETAKTKQAAKEKAQAAKTGDEAQFNPNTFSGGPIQGTFEQRRAARIAAEDARRGRAMEAAADTSGIIGQAGVTARLRRLAQSQGEGPLSAEELQARLAAYGENANAAMKIFMPGQEIPVTSSATLAKIPKTAPKIGISSKASHIVEAAVAGVKAVAPELKNAMADAPLVINVFLNQEPVGSVQGTAKELNRAANTQNPRVAPLGKV